MPRLQLAGTRLLGLLLAGVLLSACSSNPAPSSGSGGAGGTSGSGGSAAGTGGGGSGGSGSGGAPAADVPPAGSGGAVADVAVSNDLGGTVDVRPADTGQTPPAQSDCPAGALMCDDFENYPLGTSDLAPNWTTQIVGGAIKVETSKPFGGTKGLRISTTLSPPGEPPRAANNGGPVRAASLIKEGAPLFPLPGNAFFGRVMMWLTRMPQDGVMGGVHFSNIEANGRLPDGTIAKYGEGGMFRRLLAGYTIRPRTEVDVPPVDCGKSSPTGLPEGKWVCVEWNFDGAKDEMHYWFDGTLQREVDIVKTGGGCAVPWRAPKFDKLYIGWRHSQPSPIDVEMWMDNIVLSTTRIGCPTKP